MSSDELIKQAKAAINENDETKADDIQYLREKLQEEVGLSVPTSDEFLLRFLRAELFNRDKALQLIFKYYKFRLKYADKYKNFYPSGMKHVLEHGSTFVTVAEPNPKQGLAILVRLGRWKPDICSFDELITSFHMMVEIAIREEAVQIGGIRIVYDYENFGLSYLPYTPIGPLIRMTSIVQDSFPARFNGIHAIRQTRAFSVLYSLSKPFLSESIKSRLFLHGTDYESLFPYVPAEILPTDFGGLKPPADNNELLDSIMDLDDYFKEYNAYGYKK